MVTSIELLESPGLFELNFCLWGWIKSEIYRGNVDAREELLADILDAAAMRIKERVGQLKQNKIFAHELQNTLRLTMGLPNICFGLQNICHFCVINLSLQL
jgi:hypothetical protein